MHMSQAMQNNDKIVVSGSQVEEVFIEKGGATHCDVELQPGACLNLYVFAKGAEGGNMRGCDITAHLSRDSRLNVFAGILNADDAENNITVHLDAPGAEARINGFALLDGNRRCSTKVSVAHHAPHCVSDQLFKYIVEDTAHGLFSGLIRVDEGATGTLAYQNNRNILASEGARMNSEPQLEIYCDDVRCSHGSATGQLNERALFYMRSRGIEAAEARSMLMNAFLADVIDIVEDERLRDDLRQEVEQRLTGTL